MRERERMERDVARLRGDSGTIGFISLYQKDQEVTARSLLIESGREW